MPVADASLRVHQHQHFENETVGSGKMQFYYRCLTTSVYSHPATHTHISSTTIPLRTRTISCFTATPLSKSHTNTTTTTLLGDGLCNQSCKSVFWLFYYFTTTIFNQSNMILQIDFIAIILSLHAHFLQSCWKACQRIGGL